MLFAHALVVDDEQNINLISTMLASTQVTGDTNSQERPW